MLLALVVRARKGNTHVTVKARCGAHEETEPNFPSTEPSREPNHSPATARQRIIDEALDVAKEAGDPNRVVTVSAWPIKVLVVDGQFDRVVKQVDRLLNGIGTEPSPVRRADALTYLFGAVIRAQRHVTIPVIETLVSACLEPLQNGRRNRKGESLLSNCLPAIARIDERIASDALSRLPDARANEVRERMLSLQTTTLDQLAPWPRVSDG